MADRRILVWRHLVIDFRYHVVSLTAVFLALAVGVVLGSGPLRTALVSELTNQTQEVQGALRDSQAETADAIRTGEMGQEFVAQASSDLIGGSLDGRHVAIIRLLQPDGAEITNLRERVVEAGALVTANLTIEPDWTDEGQSAFRTAFASQVASNVVGVDSTVAPDRVLAHALAQVLVPTEFPEGTETEVTSATANPADRSAVLFDLLKGAEFVTGTVLGEVDSVIFVVGPGPEAEEDLAYISGTFSDLVGIMDQYVDGTIVATGPARVGDLESTIQASALLQDNVTTALDSLNYYGSFTIVLGLAKEVTGVVGHYGYGDGLQLYPGRVPAT
jgi:hypothetical protein